MRTSSVKTIVSAIALALTLTVIVPSAEARTVHNGRKGRGETIMRAAIDLLKRLGGFTSNAGPSVPLGEPVADDTTKTPTGEQH
ncbi:MAG TPA: hypothetical protein VGD79_12460 [Thermoanaerobaculia bacterium]|jgi:hypothetical protein